MLVAGEADTLVEPCRLGIRDDLDPGRAALARDPHRVLDERTSNTRAHVCRLDEQAVEFASALHRLEQHGEADDVRGQLGDANETSLDLVDRELDHLWVGGELLAIRVPVHRRAALQLNQRSLLSDLRVTDQQGLEQAGGAIQRDPALRLNAPVRIRT
jgi:hypothetical protein